jgi:hypothetical protein
MFVVYPKDARQAVFLTQADILLLGRVTYPAL